jgi:hypothetical protein
MQVTLDLPAELAEQVVSEQSRLAVLLARGLRAESEGLSAFRREVISFLAKGPRPAEIAAFNPSETVVDRARELRWKNQETSLSATEEAEMQEFGEIDTWLSLLKAEARLHLRQ